MNQPISLEQLYEVSYPHTVCGESIISSGLRMAQCRVL